MKYKFKVLNWDHIDSDGDMFTKDSIKTPLSVPVAIEFDPSRVVGKAEIKKQNSGLFAELETKKDVKGLYPAIGYEEISNLIDPETGVKTVTEIKLHWVGLSMNQNTDPNIKPI